MSETNNDPFADDFFDDTHFTGDPFSDDPFDDTGGDSSPLHVPRKRKNSESNRRRNLLIYFVVFVLSATITVALNFLADPVPTTNTAFTAEQLPAYSFDEQIIATETAKFVTQYPALADWNRHQNMDVSLWLPPEFAQLDINAGIESALLGLEALGTEAAYQAEIVRQNPDMYRFMAHAGRRSVVVTRERPLVALSYDQYMTHTENMLPPSISLNGYEMIELQGVAAVRYEVTESFNFGNLAMVGYMIQDGDYIYVITFSDFDDVLDKEQYALYDQIMQTFRVSRTD